MQQFKHMRIYNFTLLSKTTFPNHVRLLVFIVYRFIYLYLKKDTYESMHLILNFHLAICIISFQQEYPITDIKLVK